MPATRSSGPPTALQPILMEALENFKQRHSKQNQDLIHKNRLLLKSTAELERVVKELKNENLELRIQLQKTHSQAQTWRQKAESGPPHQFGYDQIRLAVLDIANRCKTLESSLSQPQPSSSTAPSELTPSFDSIPPAPSTAHCLPSLLPVRNRTELIALRERRRSQLAVEPEESRLSFINECSATDDRSESTLPFELSQTGNLNPNLHLKPSSSNQSTNPASKFLPGPSNQLMISSGHQYVAPRSKLRQELMAPFPKSSGSRQIPKFSNEPDLNHDLAENSPKTSRDEGADESEEYPAEDGSHQDDSYDEGHQSVVDDELNTGSFSAPDRAMSQFDRSSSSSSDSGDDPDQAASIDVPDELKDEYVFPEEQRTSILRDRRSKKQRRTSLTPQHIFETVSPATFSLNPLTCPAPESLPHALKAADHTSLPERPQPTDPDPPLALPSSTSKRRDSGRTKTEGEKDDDEETEEKPASQDEGWEKRRVAKKKRPRAELDAVSEEHPGQDPGSLPDSLPSNLSGAGPREARRARKEVNYALPSLNKKMRRPASQGSTTSNRKSSVSGVKSVSNVYIQPPTLEKKSLSSSKPCGATPSTVESNTSSGSTTNQTTLTVGSSPLSSTLSTLSDPSSSSSRLASLLIPPSEDRGGPREPGRRGPVVEGKKPAGGGESRGSKAGATTATAKAKKRLGAAGRGAAEALGEVGTNTPVVLETIARRAEQRNKENARSGGRPTLSSSTGRRKKAPAADPAPSSSRPPPEEALDEAPIHLRGLRRLTRDIVAGIDVDKLAASLGDEGRQILFNNPRRRTQSLHSE